MDDMGRDQTASGPVPPREPRWVPADAAATRRARGWIAALAVALVGVSVGYRIISGAGLEQTSVLYIALPAILAIAVAMSPPTRSATGVIFKTSTIVMLLAGILLGETLICMLVASPLVYLVGGVVGAAIDYGRRRRAQGAAPRAHHAVIVMVLLAGLEGTTPALDVPRHASVTVERYVAATPAQVEATLAAPPLFATPPALLRIGFPRVISSAGSGLAVGDRRTITILGSGHHGTTVVGDLVMEVTRRGPGEVRFTALRDDTRVASWLSWQTADVRWTAHGDGTMVSWSVAYRRELTPSWYFGPLQRGAVHLSADYLIDSMATPRG